MIRSWIVVALALAACGKSKATCKADVDALMTFFTSFDHDPSLFMVSDGNHLVVRIAAKPKAQAPVVNITATETSYQGRLVDAQALADALVDTSRRIHDDIDSGRIPKSAKVDAALLYFQIDADATWNTIVAATTAAANAGFTHAGFVFVTGETPKPPPHTWADDKLDDLRKQHGSEAGGLASGVADIASGIVKSCPAIVKLYGTVSATNEDKADFIINGTGPALIDCNCDADIPALRTVMWRLLSNPHPTSVVNVELANEGKPIDFAPTATWRDAQKALTEGAKVAFATK